MKAPPTRPSRVARRRSGGFTLIEVAIAIVVLAIAVSGFLSVMISTRRLTQEARETSLAAGAGRLMFEAVKAASFDQVYPLFNALPADDPDGAGTAPGSDFAVFGLEPWENDPDGLVGEVVFPETGGELREDIDDITLGMPRDVNGDDLVDANDHTGDYQLLPVVIRLRWRGAAGDRQIDLKTLLAE